MAKEFHIELLCKIAGISKSTYYRILKSKDRDKEIKRWEFVFNDNSGLVQ